MAEDDKFLKQSVTADEIPVVSNGAVLNMIIPYYGGYDRVALPPQPPVYWTPNRDVTLRATVHHEAMWAGAIGIAITKVASQAFNIVSKKPRKAKEAQQLLIGADGSKVGWVGFISKTLRDFLTTDNGAFIEVVRETKYAGSKIVGLRHLDSVRCVRSGNPDTPVIYRDRVGRLHEMRDYQVIMFSDMPDPGETYYGTGLSSASRAYNAIYKLSTIEWYLREKVGGLHPLAIHIVNGVLDQQLKGAVEAVKTDQVARGLTSYMGAVIVGVPQEQQPSLVTIPLAEIPDRFNRKEEFDIAVLTYANAIGLDVQDLQPLSGQGLGTGTQSTVLADKAQGKGLVSFRQAFTHAMNHYVLPDGVEFEWTEKDYRDITQQVDISQKRVNVSKTRIDAGITTKEQELQILIDADELPKEFQTTAHTPEESLSDTEDPDEEMDTELQQQVQPPQPATPKTDQPPAKSDIQSAIDNFTKKEAADGIDALLRRQLPNARKLAIKARAQAAVTNGQ